MKRNQRMKCLRHCLAFLLMINCILMFGEINVHAQSASVSVTLPLEQTFLGDEASASTSATTFRYEMLPENAENPMPEGTNDGVYAVMMTGTTAMYTSPIEYTHAGVFVYTVKACSQNDTARYVPDEEEYRAYVHVKKQPDDTLDATVVAMNKANVKVSRMGFSYEIKDANGLDGGESGGSNGGGSDSGGSDLGGIGGDGNGGSGGSLGGSGDLGTGGNLGAGDAGSGMNASGTGGTSGDAGTDGFGNNAKGSSVNTGDYAETYILWAIIVAMCMVIIFLFRKKRLDFYEQT